MKKLKLLIILTLMLASSFSHAIVAIEHDSTIKSIYTTASGRFLLMFNEDSEFCKNGNTPFKHYNVNVSKFDVTEKGADRIYSAALMALTTGKKVHIIFDGDSYQCDILALRVDYK